MDPWPREFDQRKSYRCPLPEGRRAAELRVRRRRIPVELFNESSGGYAALVDADPKLKVDERLELLSDGARIEVRVAYVTRTESDQAGGAASPGSYRIGLERLSDLGPSAGRPTSAGIRVASKGHSLRTKPGAAGVVGALLLILAAAVCGLAVITYWLARPPAAAAGPRLRDAAPVDAAPAVPTDGLTADEQNRATSLARQTADALAEIDVRWRDISPEQRAERQQQFAEAVRRELLQRLGPEARQQWATLLWTTGSDDVAAASQQGKPAP